MLCAAMLFPAFFATHALETDAAAAVLLDAVTGQTLYAKNENVRRGMASTTKIMSALIALERGDFSRVYTVNAEDAAVEGSALGLRKGNRLRLEALLKGMMLVSGNDAAHALANAVAGSQEAFVKMMNAKAHALGLQHTHFANPSGLSDEQHYSTALDMALLTAYALRNRQFASICAKSRDKIVFISPKKQVVVQNHNRLLREYEGCIGVKTGFTQAAGRCLVSAAQKNGQTLIAVTLADAEDWQDHKKLLDFGFSQSEEIVFRFQKTTLPVVGSGTQSVGFCESEVSFCTAARLARHIHMQIEAEHFLYAPVVQGQQVASVVIRYRDKVIKRIPLHSAADAPRLVAEKSKWEQFWESIIHYGKFGSQTSKIYGR